MKRNLSIFLFLILAVLFTFNSVSADEITDSIDKAKALYNQGKHTEAVQELNYAIAQIQTKQSEGYSTALPEPLPGWKADAIENQSAGMGFLGGGISVQRHYYKENGDESITISTVSDSPLLSSVVMMMGNPMFLGGNKLVTIKEQKAIEEWDEEGKYGQLQIVLENRMLITVEGSGVSKDDLYAYAEKVNFAALKGMLNK